MMSVLFGLFAIAACGGAMAVVIEKDVVRMAFWLIVSLGSVAGLFFLLGADFVGATQLLVYVGGTVVLLIFGVMLTATGPLSRSTAATKGEQMLAGVIGASLLCVFSVSLLAIDWNATPNPAPFAEGGTTRPLGLMLLGLEVERLRESTGEGPVIRERDRMSLDSGLSSLDSSGYLLPFEIASVHLLVVLIGAAYLARAKRRRRGPGTRGQKTGE